MNNVRNNIRKGFTVIPNVLVNDNAMTPQARFLFVYMASKPDDWRFYQRALAQDMGWSLDTLRKYQTELIEKGWMSREQNRKGSEKFDGFDYTLHPEPCRNFSDTVKIRSGKNPQRENSVLTNTVNTEQINTSTNNNSLSPAKKIEEKIEPVPMPEHIWGQGSETRLEKAQAALNEYLEENPSRPGEIANTARNVCDAEQFRDELDQWIRRNADDWAITQNPVKALTSGRSNFVSWLAQPWCREKYLKLQAQNQSHDSTNPTIGNGRVQQRRANQAPLTFDEFQRRFGSV